MTEVPRLKGTANKMLADILHIRSNATIRFIDSG